MMPQQTEAPVPPEKPANTALGGLAALSGNMRGALWMLAAAASFASMNGLIKGLGQEMHAFEIAFFRALFGLLLVAPFAMRGGIGMVKTKKPHLHLLRAVLGVTAMITSFYAFTQLPLAAVTAILFTKPLFMIVLAVLFLGEVVRWRRWAATLVGFIGMLVILQPWSGMGLGPAALWAVLSAFAMAGALAMVKKMTETERPATMLFWFTVAATVVSAIPAAMVWQTPTGGQLALLVLIGALGSAGQYLAVRAYRVGEATLVTPLDYFQLLFAGVIGYWAFSEMPGIWTAVGAAIIVASTFYILRREARLGRTP
ncbi:DMT family transporter [Telmatospirillum sp. J64-1]|uniref:DMT family transporter n=1 Tax=Telmatospirillum sp. J64-1 TaxID=2502183 RepID=UPI00163DB68E|nr:DMT family transporter [Telmatospirillum sp. J64-1]